MISGFVPSPAGNLWFEQSEGSQGTPLVAIHGGPGFSSAYLRPLFGLSEAIPVVRYDQAGCGVARERGPRKTHSIAAFVDELEALRTAIGADSMHLLGHSFGGLIAGEYALAFKERVRSVVFASVSIDIPRWRADAERLRQSLPLMTKMVLREGERTGQFESPQYLTALAEYYDRFVFRFDAKPDLIIESELASDPVTYSTVWGPNELVVTGACRDYSLSPRLPELEIPTLFTCGRFDEATPESHLYFASLVSGAEVEIFEDSAHHPHLNETQRYLARLRKFYERIGY